MTDLKGKNALLTGGSGGLGLYIARALADEGVNLGLSARREEPLQRAAQELADRGARAVALPADISRRQARQDLLARFRRELGPLDFLINNAGIEFVCAYTDMPHELIQGMLETNLMGPLLLTREALPEMIEQGSGHVVTISSLGGKKGSPYSATYAATKAGLIAWNSGLREELRGSGVSASVVCPGFVAEAGMFAVYNKRPPRLTGQTTPRKVARAVVRAIKKDVGEIVVNPGPVRPMMLLEAVHPGIMTWVLRSFGVYDFYQGQAQDNQRQIGRGHNQSGSPSADHSN